MRLKSWPKCSPLLVVAAILTLFGVGPRPRAALRDAQYRAGMFSDAVATGRQAEQNMLQASPGNRCALAENWLLCGTAFAGLGQPDSARDRFERALNQEQCARDVPWLPVYVRQAERWLRRLGS